MRPWRKVRAVFFRVATVSFRAATVRERFLRLSCAALAVFCLIGASPAQTVSTGDPMQHRIYAIGEKLKCQCSCPYTLGSCNMLNCEFRTPTNAQIRRDLEAGLSEEAILAKLTQQYGTQILAYPPARGFNLLAWVMPFVALLLGIFVVRYIVLHWRKPAVAATAAPAAGAPIPERYRERIEKDLADWE